MRKAIADQWVEALRSGKYSQTQSRLHDGQGFCCLGVLCDISGLGAWTVDRENDSVYSLKDEDGLSLLPVAVQSWAGLKTHLAQMEGGPSLAALNDEGKSFSEIADVISQKWMDL